MKPLSRTDRMHLEAAKGWLTLGNHLETNQELEKITASLRAHPNVLEVRWRVYAREDKWEMCVEIAQALTKMVPRSATSWAVLATSLKRVGRAQEAYEMLLKVIDKFPKDASLPLQLSVLAMHLGKVEDGVRWVQETLKRDPSKKMKLDVLQQKELEELWKRIGDIGKSN